VDRKQDSLNLPLRGDPGYPQYSPSYDQGFSSTSNYDQPAFNESSYPPPPVQQPYHDREMEYNDGFAHREGLAPTTPAGSPRRDHLAFLKSKWPAAFMATTAVQAVICLVCESYIFARVQSSVQDGIEDSPVRSEYLTIPTFLTLFIFGFLYELVIVWDALRLKNTIQVIGVCIANLALVVYTGIQVDSIQTAVKTLSEEGVLESITSVDEVWQDVRPFLVTIPAILALGTIVLSLISWKLYQEFAWDILKNIGADYRMKRRFLHYQIYIALLKFDFFFFLGFIVQFVVIVASTQDIEFVLTIVSIPICIIILLTAAFFTRRENRFGMIAIIFLYFGGLSYFIFKLARMYQEAYEENYIAARRSLTAFAVITILLILLTISNAIVCMYHFNKGLKAHLLAPTRNEEKADLNSISLQDAKAPAPSRMTID
jgi:hypothetical protein